MRYDIELEISYRYSSPADAGRHILRMQPRNLPGEQRVVASALVIDPATSEQTLHYDFYGNSFVAVDFDGLQKEITFKSRARVDRELVDNPIDESSPQNDLQRQISEVRDLGSDSPLHFLAQSPYVSLHDSVTQHAVDITQNASTTMAAAETLGAALYEEMKYDPKATNVNTPLLEAFQKRHGVCQDYSHIMIAGLRGLGIPAGYVSGFLRTNVAEGEPFLEGADAMHAWVRVWCGGTNGWVEYDPTNRMFATRDHVVIARGRDYGDVSPVKGLMRTAGEQTSEQRVTVRLLD